MSYEKAMKHARNVRKCRKQKKMYMGFDTGTDSFKESPECRALNVQRMEVSRWFSERHNGDSAYNRECIRQSISELRSMVIKMFNPVSVGDL